MNTPSPRKPRPVWLQRDVIVALCVAAASILYMLWARDIRRPPFADPLGPRAFPYLVGALGLVGAGWLLLETWLRHRRQQPATIDPEAQGAMPIPVIVVTLWSILFFVFFEQVGFPIGGTVYMLVLTAMLNRGQWLVNIVFSVVVTVVLHLSFKNLLGVPLPDGPIWF